jgi:hypothetical protein
MSGSISKSCHGTAPPVSDALTVAVRTYSELAENKSPAFDFSVRGPSRRHLVFDTETTTDEAQRLRIGSYQIREGDTLSEQGLFYDPTALSRREIAILKRYAAAKRMTLITLTEFAQDVFVRVAYHWQGTTIGFNLPFDLARISEGHGDARGKMRPGFTLSPVAKGPRVRVKHLSRRASLIEFSGAGQRLPRGQRKRKVSAPPRRPAFVDVATLAAALLSRTFSLGGLAKDLGTAHRKLETEEHGKALTAEYLDYAIQDVQVTWECFVELRKRYGQHGLGQTPIHRILSEASIGKGYLREMGIKPWREMQPDFPPERVGEIMGTYFGGRTEVRQRRVVTQVLYCDFTSMYPTVSTLMVLWRFVIAKGMTWRDATDETREFLERITVADLQRSDTWRNLTVLVQIQPDGDILPVRAKYAYEPGGSGGHQHYTIGLNHLTSDQPAWYALGDCIASKLLTGRTPRILKAVAYEAGEPQEGLRPVAIAGNEQFRVNPLKDDFYKRLIELRLQTKGEARNALKLILNAMSYGIFVQQDVNERSEPIPVRCYPANGPQFLVDTDKVEQPGEFFHPLLGALITSGARLMLAIAERQVADTGLTWTFCDTDSMAIAKPEGMSDADFYQRAESVRTWFKPLNPYTADVQLFKIEDVNFGLKDGVPTREIEPLYCFAISSKRYVMFNIGPDGEPVIRKATAHGLGHLLPPYRDDGAPAYLPRPVVPLDTIGVSRWQHDLWHCIARAALHGNRDRPDFSALPNFDRPAVTQYSATTAHLMKWFDSYNADKPYSKQVRPFNFLLMFQADPLADWDSWRQVHGIELPGQALATPCVIAPFESDPKKASAHCFDRDTGKPIPAKMLKTYGQALAQYHLRPEPKFLNADFRDIGETQRRHVQVTDIAYIGKEANRWEEQSYLGADPEAEIVYGAAKRDHAEFAVDLKTAIERFGSVAIAKAAGVSRQHLTAIVQGDAKPSDKMVERLKKAIVTQDYQHRAADSESVGLFAKVREIGVRKCARLAELDPGHLTRIANGTRKATTAALEKLKTALAMDEDARQSTSAAPKGLKRS